MTEVESERIPLQVERDAEDKGSTGPAHTDDEDYAEESGSGAQQDERDSDD